MKTAILALLVSAGAAALAIACGLTTLAAAFSGSLVP